MKVICMWVPQQPSGSMEPAEQYSHHGAGVAALLAALSDQEGAVRLPAEQLLGLGPVQIPDKPALLVVVRQGSFFLVHGAAPRPKREES